MSGNYDFNGEMFSLSIIKTVRGALADVYPTSLCRKEWVGKTAHTGDNILYGRAISPEFPESGYLIFHTESATVTLEVRTEGNPINDTVLKAISQCNAPYHCELINSRRKGAANVLFLSNFSFKEQML